MSKPAKDDKVQTGLRIPEAQYNILNERAKKTGVSINALALMLIDIGLEAITLGTQEAAHSQLHNFQDIS